LALILINAEMPASCSIERTATSKQLPWIRAGKLRRFSMERLVIAAVVLVALAYARADAAPLLTRSQAREKAVQILKGDPYGIGAAEVTKHIKLVRLARSGNTRACGPTKGPAWEVHVIVRTPDKGYFNNGVIDGYLALDTRTGKLLCTNLPLVD
jgi:hypothetical protein